MEIGGPSAVVAYALAAFGAYLVYDKLSQMTAEDPMEGSFRSYAKKAFGRWAGFSSGWVYWSSELFDHGEPVNCASSIFTLLVSADSDVVLCGRVRYFRTPYHLDRNQGI
nr:hypothetical protein [Paenibacillus sp. Y412MC10]